MGMRCEASLETNSASPEWWLLPLHYLETFCAIVDCSRDPFLSKARRACHRNTTARYRFSANFVICSTVNATARGHSSSQEVLMFSFRCLYLLGLSLLTFLFAPGNALGQSEPEEISQVLGEEILAPSVAVHQVKSYILSRVAPPPSAAVNAYRTENDGNGVTVGIQAGHVGPHGA